MGDFSFSYIMAEIRAMRSEGWSYQFIGRKYGVNKGIIWTIANDGQEPKAPDIRAKLGLPAIAPD